jgi:hypothetical protein|tara:strand:- start:121 stop:489 length:369 start_codon:yes stop_codon:yes gene_type:complete
MKYHVKMAHLKQIESEKVMQAFTIKYNHSDETISTMAECAKQYFIWHKAHSHAKDNLEAIKKAIKSDDGLAWFQYGIAVTLETPSKFNKATALELLEKLGATQAQIESCYKETKYQKVSNAK